MRRFRLFCQRFGLAITLVFAAHLVCVLGMAVSESWHHAIHQDCDDDDHDCGAVVLAHGGFFDQLETILPVERPPLPEPLPLTVSAPENVPALFLSWRLLEHAPPAA